MRNLCPKCLGMKKFYVGIPVPEKCEDHPTVNLIHVNNIIEMPADAVPENDEFPKKKPLSPRETVEKVVLPRLKSLGIDTLRQLGKKLEIKNWWILKEKNLIKAIKKAVPKEIE